MSSPRAISACEATNGAAPITCGIAARLARGGAPVGAARRRSASLTSTCAMTESMRSRTSFWKPFITDSTMISAATPSAMPSIDTPEMNEMKPLRCARPGRPACSASRSAVRRASSCGGDATRASLAIARRERGSDNRRMHLLIPFASDAVGGLPARAARPGAAEPRARCSRCSRPPAATRATHDSSRRRTSARSPRRGAGTAATACCRSRRTPPRPTASPPATPPGRC